MKPFALLAVVIALFATGCKKKPKLGEDGANGQNDGGGAAVARGPGGGVVIDGGLNSSGGGGGGGTFSAGGGGSGGAVQSVRRAVTRLKDGLVEFKNLGLVIQMLHDQFMKMPTKDEIIAELKQYPKMQQAVKDGAVILTGTREIGGLWAYEVDSETSGGIILVSGTATRATADEVKQHIAALPADVRAKLPTAEPPPTTDKSKPAATVTMKDMEDIRLFIHDVSAVSGKMPSKQQVLAALTQAGSPAAQLVKSEAIIINPARADIWAYEAKALQQGGWVASSNGVEQLSAAELKRRLGR